MASVRSLKEDIQKHYARTDLGTAILAALTNAGKDINNLKPEDLHRSGEFHIRRRQATLELAHAVGLDATQHVLDVGSGVEGPHAASRTNSDAASPASISPTSTAASQPCWPSALRSRTSSRTDRAMRSTFRSRMGRSTSSGPSTSQ